MFWVIISGVALVAVSLGFEAGVLVGRRRVLKLLTERRVAN